MVEEEGNDKERWGTWEELVLGGAVVRHGSQAWDVVASELQTRTVYPELFTPQVCKAKYDDLLERYSGSSAWFEELRKRRVDELRRALEKSEDSIGSLESKLVSLKVEGVHDDADYSSSRAESPVFLKSEGNECSGREVSKDRSSAGSFTQETQTTCSPRCQNVVEASPEKAVVLEHCRLEKFPSIDKLAKAIQLEQGLSIRRKRGKRKRKNLSKDVKEGSVGETIFSRAVDSVDASQGKEIMTTGCGQPVRLPDANDQNPCTSKQEVDEFTKRRRNHLNKDVNEGIFGENDFLGAVDSVGASQGNEKLRTDCGQPARLPANDMNPCTSKQEVDDFTKRRRKHLIKDVKEGIVGENNFVGAVDSVGAPQGNEKLTTGCCSQPARLLANDHNPCTSKRKVDSAKRRKHLSKDVKEAIVRGNNSFGAVDPMGASQGKDKLRTDCVRRARLPTNDQNPCTSKLEVGFTKKRKNSSKDVKEGSVGENNFLGAIDFNASQGKEKVTTSCGKPARLPDANDQNPCTSNQEVDDATKILDSILENQHASVFRHRLDSQKRARYKKVIRKHMDLDTIRSRIANKSITSSVELLRDLLLLANNALVFYSKSTREYKCALVLRDLVKKLRHHHKVTHSKTAAPAETQKSPVRKPPAKPRSARPFNRKSGNKAVNAEIGATAVPKEGKRSHPLSNVGSPSSAESSVLTKKSIKRRGKVGCVKRGSAGIQAETPMKVRKRARESSRVKA